jgi:hypothetical protein
MKRLLKKPGDVLKARKDGRGGQADQGPPSRTSSGRWSAEDNQ